MKRLAYILAIYILFCAVAPCYLFDNCEEETTYAETKEQPFKDCNNCSPFSTCSSCHGFAYRQEAVALAPAVFRLQPVYVDHSFTFSDGYRNALFQPPRALVYAMIS